jgi:hypothetical protein
MRARSVVLTALLCVLAFATSFAQDPNLGTWKLNEGKSKIAAGMMKNTTVVYTVEGDSIKAVTDGTTGDGSPLHTEWTGKFDGKDYPLTGDPTADMRSYKKVNDRTLMLENKKAGKVTTSGKIAISADGKSRTLTLMGTSADGKKLTGTAVYDKQ